MEHRKLLWRRHCEEGASLEWGVGDGGTVVMMVPGSDCQEKHYNILNL